MSRTMCKFKKKQGREELEELKKIIAKPKYFCKKCLRVAAEKKNLCKPEKI